MEMARFTHQLQTSPGRWVPGAVRSLEDSVEHIFPSWVPGTGLGALTPHPHPPPTPRLETAQQCSHHANEETMAQKGM